MHQKGCGFDSPVRTHTEVAVPSLVGARMESNQSMILSHTDISVPSLSLFLPLFLKSINIPLGEG